MLGPDGPGFGGSEALRSGGDGTVLGSGRIDECALRSGGDTALLGSGRIDECRIGSSGDTVPLGSRSAILGRARRLCTSIRFGSKLSLRGRGAAWIRKVRKAGNAREFIRSRKTQKIFREAMNLAVFSWHKYVLHVSGPVLPGVMEKSGHPKKMNPSDE
jgi:hypothetical protein